MNISSPAAIFSIVAIHLIKPNLGVAENVRICIWVEAMADLVAQGCSVVLQACHALWQIKITLLIKHHLVRCFLLRIMAGAHRHTVIETDNSVNINIYFGKQSFASISDMALFHLHKERLIWVRKMWSWAEDRRSCRIKCIDDTNGL